MSAIIKREFPVALLRQPIESRLTYFRAKTVDHFKLRISRDNTLHYIQAAPQGSTILICGPTGVGKTTLAESMLSILYDLGTAKMHENPGHIPVLMINAIAPDSGMFNWKDFYKRALIEAKEPLIDQKRKSLKRRNAHESLKEYNLNNNSSNPSLRLAYESCLLNRAPIALIIDEGQHMAIMPSGRRLRDNMEVIKSLASNTLVQHVLVGTYDLLTLANLSGQLARRNRIIHFPRYRFEIKEDMEEFMRIILTFQKHLPLYDEPNLIDQYEYLYEKSLGCVGILKTHLLFALAEALKQGKNKMSREILERNAISSTSLRQIAQEIVEREKMLEDNHDSDIRTMLGISEIENEASTVNPSPNRVKRRVGERKPYRDPVGRN